MIKINILPQITLNVDQKKPWSSHKEKENPITKTSIISNMPWLSAPTVSHQEKVVKKKVKEITNPIFQECLEFITDDHYRFIFSEAVKGKLPRNFTFSKTILSYRRKTKVESIEIPSDPYTATCLIIDFFRSKGGIRSSEDLLKEKKDQEEYLLSKALTQFNNCEWNNIENKSLERSYVAEYIRKMAEIYEFTPKEKRDFKTYINTGLLLGFLTNENIVFSDNQIHEIKGISFDKKSQPKFKVNINYGKKKINKKNIIDPYDCLDLNKKKDSVFPRVNLENKWKKYIENISSQETEKNSPNISVPPTPGVMNILEKTPSVKYNNDNIPIADSFFDFPLQTDDFSSKEDVSTMENFETSFPNVSIACSSYGYARMFVRS